MIEIIIGVIGFSIIVFGFTFLISSAIISLISYSNSKKELERVKLLKEIKEIVEYEIKKSLKEFEEEKEFYKNLERCDEIISGLEDLDIDKKTGKIKKILVDIKKK